MNILIVESKAKSRTIQKYLGRDWVVLATGGHVQELPDRKDDPKEGKKAYWANRAGELPAPPWAWTENGEKAVRAIVKAAAGHGDARFFLATDPDREGEFIAWRLAELLAQHGEVARVTFREVTSEAIDAAIAEAGAVDMDLVYSAMVRRFLDRLVGFRASKMAKSFVSGRSASMGRVQTPALGFVVDRELEREAHVPVEYFEVTTHTQGLELQVRFHERKDPGRWEDDSGKYLATRTADVALAEHARDLIAKAPGLSVTGVKPSERSERPRPAFATDALLQAAGSRWGWSPKKTMKLASSLYEAGHITYIRTDSNRLANSARADARALISSTWGADHVGPGALGKPSAGKVQDAHEAIRPTRISVQSPDGMDEDTRRLYALIRAQVLASQMAPARQARLAVTAEAEELDRPLTGSLSWYVALGWRAAFSGIDSAPAIAPPSGLEAGARLALLPDQADTPNPELRRGETQPPGRYRAHTLVKAMKDAGIGRPSTYASTVETLADRKYMTDEGGALAPTPDGRQVWLAVAPMYALPEGEPLFDVGYTAAMEERLDEVAEGTEAAPQVWEMLRDAFRSAHESAQQQRRSGKLTPAQRTRLEALLANAPEALTAGLDLEALSWEDASALMTRLRDEGVLPAPTERQLAEIQRLVEVIGTDAAAAAALVGLESLDQVRTAAGASELIDGLRERLPEVTKPSDKQLRFLADLVKKAGLTEAEACGRVGADGFEVLTGGPGPRPAEGQWRGTQEGDAMSQAKVILGKDAAEDDGLLSEVVQELHAQAGQLATPLRRTFTGQPLPSLPEVITFVELLRAVIFPGYFGDDSVSEQSLLFHLGSTLHRAQQLIVEQVRRGLCFVCTAVDGGACDCTLPECEGRARRLTAAFIRRLPDLRRLLALDAAAAYEGDPAASSTSETIFCYPGVTAITSHRIAHELHVLGVPLIPRIICEHAHSVTGIDIHPGATIGERFFIDHGTGVVIGETTIIGDRVRLYQGVTLGAKSFPLDDDGNPIKGVDRHPILEDDVTVYAGSTILGRVRIGAGSTIGGNLWITRDVPPGSKISQARAVSERFESGGGI